MGQFKALQRFERLRLVLEVDLPDPGNRGALAEAVRNTELPRAVENQLRGKRQVDAFAKCTTPGKATVYLTFEANS
jgi:hypothetical protein